MLKLLQSFSLKKILDVFCGKINMNKLKIEQTNKFLEITKLLNIYYESRILENMWEAEVGAPARLRLKNVKFRILGKNDEAM